MWLTLRIVNDYGEICQRRRKRTTPLYRLQLRYDRLTAADIQTLFAFYCARSGGFEAFNVFDFIPRAWSGESVGTGDGAENTFNAGAKNISDYTVYVDGEAKKEDVAGSPDIAFVNTDDMGFQNTDDSAWEKSGDYTISAGTGTDGQDQILFSPDRAPAVGAVITIDFTGQKHFTSCVFTEDNMSLAHFSNALFSTGLDIQQVTA